MARPTIDPRQRRSVSISAAITQRLKTQAELAARSRGVTVAAFLEGLIEIAVNQTKLPRSTGIRPQTQHDPRVLARLQDFILEDLPAVTIPNESILWDDDDPAVLFFRLCYLMPDLLTPRERQTWDAIKSATLITFPYVDATTGQERQAWTEGDQEKCEAYVKKHWGEIQRACAGTIPPMLLPIEREVRVTDSVAKPEKGDKNARRTDQRRT